MRPKTQKLVKKITRDVMRIGMAISITTCVKVAMDLEHGTLVDRVRVVLIGTALAIVCYTVLAWHSKTHTTAIRRICWSQWAMGFIIISTVWIADPIYFIAALIFMLILMFVGRDIKSRTTYTS